MSYALSGTTALVTGANLGIGDATVRTGLAFFTDPKRLERQAAGAP